MGRESKLFVQEPPNKRKRSPHKTVRKHHHFRFSRPPSSRNPPRASVDLNTVPKDVPLLVALKRHEAFLRPQVYMQT